MASPLMETASPFSKPMVMTVGVSGASSGDRVRWCTNSGASTAGSSSTLPSEEECRRLASTLKGASPRLSLAMGIWCFSANSSRASRDLNAHSRQGAMTRMSGSRA